MRETIIERRRRKKQTDARQFELSSDADPDAPLDSIESFDGYLAFGEGGFTQSTQEKALARPKARINQEDLLKEDLRPTFQQLRLLAADLDLAGRSGKENWIVVAAGAIEHFRAYKAFWPWDKAHKFNGYSRTSRKKAVQGAARGVTDGE